MAVITSALLTALNTGYKRDFEAGKAKATPMWDRVATEVTSSTAKNTYGWLGQFPRLREWVGDRVVKSMQASAYEIVNKTFEATVGVKRDDIEDDQFGVYGPMMQEMGYAAATEIDLNLWPLLKAGDATLCYDGQYFFDADHPVYANVDGTGTASSVSNVTAGSGAPWYLLATKRPLKPMIVQRRRAAQFVTKFSAQDSDHVFLKNEYLWGVDMRFNVGFGLWQLAHMSKADLTADTLFAAYSAMQGVKADGGRPLGVTPDLLVVPPSLHAAGKKALAERDDAGASSAAFGLVDMVVVPWLA